MCDAVELSCDNCDYMKLPHEGAYCYMFRGKLSIVEERGFCLQHTALPRPTRSQIKNMLLLVRLLLAVGAYEEESWRKDTDT